MKPCPDRMRKNICSVLVLSGALVALSTCVAAQQQRKKAGNEYIPLPSPGYTLYYHDSDDAPAAADRWGYYDGWQEGRKDRNHGINVDPATKPNYLRPSQSVQHQGQTTEQYNRSYRTAFLRGYKNGYRI